MDYSKIIKNKKKDCFIYLDPPYYKKGNSLYSEKFSHKDHFDLCVMLKNMSCPWVLSYDLCKEIKSFYSWAKIHEIPATYCINGKKNNWKSKVECVISK